MLSSRRILVPIWKSGRFDDENPIAERGFVADLAPASFFEAPAMAAFLDLDGEACDAALFWLFVVGAMQPKQQKNNNKCCKRIKQEPQPTRNKHDSANNNQQKQEQKTTTNKRTRGKGLRGRVQKRDFDECRKDAIYTILLVSWYKTA
jgi:hypothetical protein